MKPNAKLTLSALLFAMFVLALAAGWSALYLIKHAATRVRVESDEEPTV